MFCATIITVKMGFLIALAIQATGLGNKTMNLRQATIDDAPHLARFATMMDGGCYEALYDGLIPGQSTESILEPMFSQSDATDFYQNHWIAEQDGQVAGGMHAFPYDDYANDPPPDPRIPEERFAIIQPWFNLPADGTYYLLALAVYPEYCRRGIGSSLLSLACEHAKEKEFTEISLHVYTENVGAVVLYEKSGFKIVDRGPIVEHPLIRYKGETILMVASL